ncbi:MAG: histidine ammonia-lyase [Lachnospiraceae bacterium]|nr:histidine ammonia-lyase [Lachnospiraceae bacterium]
MKYNPSLIKEVTLDGQSLVFEEFIAAARFHAPVKIDPEALLRMQRSREAVEKIQKSQKPAYGITTGFGDFQKVAVPEELSNRLSTNLILSHCTGCGEPYDDEVVRGILLLRTNNLLVGLSGVRPLLAEIMVQMLNRNVLPVIPQKGSLGASGDLVPLAHMTLPILGLGEAKYEGEVLPGAEAMKRAGIQTLDTLLCKEGLGMTNGTCAMTSCGALALYDSICASEMADVIASMTFEGLTGLKNAFDPRIHAARGHKGQNLVADNMRRLLEGSEILDNCQNDRVQDAYALRCIPQVHGAVRDALQFVIHKVDIELNSVTDNPLVFPEDGAVISGGNFHGEPMAIPFDLLGIACAEIADISERRIERMVNGALSNGLTPFLTVDPGVNSGYMIVQYTAASMVSENKVLAHPASVDSIPSSANQEDIVSMGTTSARKARDIVQNTLSVLGLELLTACQAIDIRRKLNTNGTGISPFHQHIYDMVRREIPFYDKDRELWPDIRKAEAFIRRKDLLDLIDRYMPELLENNAWEQYRGE